MTKLEELVRHYNFKWPNDDVDILYYWYPGMYNSKPPPKMIYAPSFSRISFESWVEDYEKQQLSNLE